MKPKNSLIYAGFILLSIAVVSSYLYFFHFDGFICFVAGLPTGSLADESPTFMESWSKVIPYKIPLLFCQFGISLLLVIYAFYIKSIKSSFLTKTARAFSTLLFIFYLLVMCLALIIPYGGILG